MRLALLGVRGSTPAPGAPFTRFGGHTSCVAVLDDSSTVPKLVLDAGTGVRDLSGLLAGAPFRGALVLSHLHWDHVHGLPFSPALDHPDSQVELWVPGNRGGDSGAQLGRGTSPEARDLLAAVMSPPHFPIDPGGLLGSWRFRLASPGRLPIDDETVGGARVEVAPVRHKGGTTFAVRVDLDGASIAYVPDHTLSTTDGVTGDADADADAVELAHGVDVLLHDGQFAGPAEAGQAAAYGHSTIEDALRWADRCQVGAVVLTHHAPTRTDDQLDALAARFTRTPDGRPVTFATQGHILDVDPPAPRDHAVVVATRTHTGPDR